MPVPSSIFRPRVPVLFLLLASTVARGQLVVNNTQTPAQLVQNVLLGGGVTASNITFNGAPANVITEQAGEFNSTNANVGITSGILLATGDVANALGPNDDGGSTTGGGFWGQTDVDLETLAGNTINDAAVLEFDFLVTGDSLKFNFVFASDEYLEFVGSQYNDVFGFFLSGPGISGPYQNNAANIALIPNTSTAVAINNVNSTSYPQFYVDNGDGFTAPYNNDPFYVQYDGLTTVLQAGAQVICGETYHIKICVGDAGDTSLDSGVFLEAGSFVSTGQVAPELTSGVLLNDSTMLEGCGLVDFTFHRLGDTTNTDTINITYGGTATAGVDYTPVLPTQLIFYPGDTAIPFFLNIPMDADGVETLEVHINQLIQCAGQYIQSDYVFYIDSPPPLDVQVSDIASDCNLTEILAPVVTGGSGIYHYAWSTGETTPTISVSPGVTTTYTLNVSDTCGVAPVDTVITVTVPVYPPLDLTLTPDTAIPCLGNADLMVVNLTGGNGSYSYEWQSAGVLLGNSTTLNVPADVPTYYSLTVTDGCGSVIADSVLTTTAPLPDIEITTSGDVTVVCPGDTTDLSVVNVTGGNGVYSYSWTDAQGNVVGTNTGIVVGVPADQVYTITIADQCGYVSDTTVATLLPHYDPFRLVLTPDTVICYGDSIELSAQVTGESGIYQIAWTDLDHSDPLLDVGPMQETTYQVVISDVCGAVISGEVTVDVEPTTAEIVATSYGQDDWYLQAAAYPVPEFYYWTLGDGTKAHEKEVYHSYLDLDEHWVHLTTVSIHGCKAVDSLLLRPPAHLYFPNAFTPDGDGVNDLFGPVGHYIEHFEMHIFDRWGEEVYRTEDFDKPWDGTVNGGGIAGSGVYVYKYKADGHLFPSVEAYGHVTLVR
ncbi:MAG: choice-of-anchor L domain-containing protein [Flavobacteriales bacterium]|nr:choice-of-anchor L domain-containing protein [Flavobacteriales bacterium]MCB9167356.1 choice-of-anchor L domain-containing protein [Flavobacteriales bacterium]